jgi:cholesterol transport system auxiliary component
MTLMRMIASLGLSLSLASCVNLDLEGFGRGGPSILHYVLEDAGRIVPAAAPVPKTLILVDTLTSAFYDSDNMAFSKQPGTRGHYQFARWTERPGKRFTDLLIARLDQEKIFSTVAQTGNNVHGDWLLTTEIIEFYHDAVKEPGAVRLVLRAEVADLGSRRLISRRTITQTVAVSSYDAKGAHLAFNQAVTAMLNDMADWLKALTVPN